MLYIYWFLFNRPRQNSANWPVYFFMFLFGIECFNALICRTELTLDRSKTGAKIDRTRPAENWAFFGSHAITLVLSIYNWKLCNSQEIINNNNQQNNLEWRDVFSSHKPSHVVVNWMLTETQPHSPSLLNCDGSKNVCSMDILQWKMQSWEASGLDYSLTCLFL